MNEWEDLFEDVAHTRDFGYVAALQKMLVAQAKCVVFMGGGAFQSHARSLYLKTHPHKERCIRDIKNCSFAPRNLPRMS